jgi:hypothetical protein
MAGRMASLSQMGFYYYFCRAIPQSQGAQRAVDTLRSQGAEFLSGGHPITKVKKFSTSGDFDREAVIGEDGSIIAGLDLEHHLLVPDVSTKELIRQSGLAMNAKAYGNFGFFADTCGVSVSQNAEVTNQLDVKADGVATGLLALALHFYPSLRPTYGWVDEFGWNLPEGKSLASHRPRFLFWATFFGPEYVRKIGRDFLKSAPGWRSVDLEDGGILHVVTESYQAWWENEQPELLAYFRQAFPKLSIYRAQPIPY